MVTEQIRAITQAAEGQATEIRREADEDAERVRQESRRDASGVLERIDQLENAVQQAVVSLRRQADAVSALVERQFPEPSSRRGRPDRSPLVLDAEVVEDSPPESHELITERADEDATPRDAVERERAPEVPATDAEAAGAEPESELAGERALDVVDRKSGEAVEPVVADEPESEPEPGPDPELEPEPEVQPVADTEPEVAPEPEPEFEPEVQPVAEPEPEPEPEVQPVAEPDLQPAIAFEERDEIAQEGPGDLELERPAEVESSSGVASAEDPEASLEAESPARSYSPVSPPEADLTDEADGDRSEVPPTPVADAGETVGEESGAAQRPVVSGDPTVNEEGGVPQSPDSELSAEPAVDHLEAEGAPFEEELEEPVGLGEPAELEEPAGLEEPAVDHPEPEGAPFDEEMEEPDEPSLEEPSPKQPQRPRGRLRSLFQRRPKAEEEPSTDPAQVSGDASSAEQDEPVPTTDLDPVDEEIEGSAPIVLQPGWWEDRTTEAPRSDQPPAEEDIADFEAYGEERQPQYGPDDGSELSVMVGHALSPGAQVEGYRVEGVLGHQSGAGIVYAATDVSTGERLALKTLSEAGAWEEADLQGLADDISRQTELDHPNIIPTRGGGGSEVGPFLIMDLVPGTSLKNLIAFRELDDLQTVDLLLPVAEALDQAAEMGVPHRDLTPDKIIVAGDPAHGAMLGDFGAGKPTRLTESELEEGLAASRYIAPEQLWGEPVSGATNVYSLAVILFECFAGSSPFDDEARTAETGDEPTGLLTFRPDLAEKLDHILRTAMAEDPGERFDTAEELVWEAAGALGEAPDDRPSPPDADWDADEPAGS